MAVVAARPLYCSEKHNETLLHELNRERFETDSFCDATLQIDGKQFFIHKCIVGKISTFFRKLFQVEMKEKYDSFANMKGLNSDIMEYVLTYIYTGSIDVNEENVFHLLSAAEFLLMDGLKICCRNYLSDNIKPENCIKLCLIGKSHKWVALERKTEKVFLSNFKEIIHKEEFLSLEKDDCMFMLSLIEDSAAVFRERDIYEGILSWVKHDVEHRKKLLPEMLKLVKFKFLPEFYLRAIKEESLVKENGQIIDLLDGEIQFKQARHNENKNLFVVINEMEVRLFDILSTTWTQLPDLPEDASGACVVAYRNYLYVICGEYFESCIQRISLSEEEAEWDAERTLSDRDDANAVVYQDKIIITGGYSSSKICAESFKDDGSKVQQVQMDPMKHGRSGHSMVACDGFLYVFGGDTPTLTEKYKFYWQMVDDKKKFSTCVAVAANKDIYVFDNKGMLEQYNVESKAWVKRSKCPIQYQKYSASFMQNKIFTFGRSSSNQSGDASSDYVLAEYDISSNSWKKVYSSPCDSKLSIFTAI